MSVKHSVFVMSRENKPLTPTSPARARKLLKAGVAEKVWSKLGTFGIRMLQPTRECAPETALGIDHGAKYEGYSVLVGEENALNIKLDLPDKEHICRKLEERRTLRRARRGRNTRRRAKRFDNRNRKGLIAPSQKAVVDSRLKVIASLFAIYPISVVGLEDARFNHAARRWGKNFSTVEIGKQQIREALRANGAAVFEFAGHETKELREKYGYQKTSDKSADKFTAHCSDSLALACGVSVGRRIEPGRFLVMDDTYRPKRRRLHDTQPAKGGVREPYSKGTVFGLRKGLLIGTKKGVGQLCGEYKGAFRYYDTAGNRRSAKRLHWISSGFMIRQPGEI